MFVRKLLIQLSVLKIFILRLETRIIIGHGYLFEIIIKLLHVVEITYISVQLFHYRNAALLLGIAIEQKSSFLRQILISLFHIQNIFANTILKL